MKFLLVLTEIVIAGAIAVNAQVNASGSTFVLLNTIFRIVVVLPLAVLVLIAGLNSRYNKVFMVMLGFIVIADIFLPRIFPIGMVFFMIFYVLNSVNTFRRALVSFSMSSIICLGIMLALGAALFVFILPKIQSFLIVPVIVYMIILAAQVAFGYNLKVMENTYAGFYAFIGSLLMFFCDSQVSLDALAKINIPYGSYINAVLYYGGLTLLAFSCFPTKKLGKWLTISEF